MSGTQTGLLVSDVVASTVGLLTGEVEGSDTSARGELVHPASASRPTHSRCFILVGRSARAGS